MALTRESSANMIWPVIFWTNRELTLGCGSLFGVVLRRRGCREHERDFPQGSLLEGAEILTKVLPEDFSFQFRGGGKSSGGNYAWGEFVRGDRKLENTREG
jgi:hypothetical protein